MPALSSNNDVLWDNVDWNLGLIVTQVGHAKKVSGRARSGYYKVAIIIAASLVEAVAHRLLEVKLQTLPSNNLPFDEWECFDCCQLPQSFSNSGVELAVCKRRRPRFILTRHTDFKRINDVLLSIGIFTKSFYSRIEKVRQARNKIHIQGLNHLGRRWTDGDLDKTASVLVSLLRKLKPSV